MKVRIWTISNGLSALRIVLILPISLALINNRQEIPALLYLLICLAVLTDLLDGKVARMLNQETELGKILDPLADKMIIGTLSLILAIQGAIPVWFFITAVTRDVILLAGGFVIRRSKNVLVQSNLIGKWTVTFTAAFITSSTTSLTPQWMYDTLLALSAGLMAISFVVYAERFLRIIRSGQEQSQPTF